jgi:ABC-type transport system substrate-binding protein
VRFQQPHFQFEYQLVNSVSFSPVAREVIEAHADDRGRNMSKPVGVGPYMLDTWVRANRIVLTANPNFRDEKFPAVPATQPESTRALAGKKLPLAQRIEIRIVEESTPRLLMLQKGEIDMLYRVPPDLVPRVLNEKGELRGEFVKLGIRSEKLMEPALNFTFFNMKDPIVGGYRKENIALRRAILMGYNTEEAIRVINKGQAIPATQLIPPGQFGHDPTLNLAAPYDPQLARALLDRFGYKDRDGDGYREMPDGKPLVIKRSSMPEARFRESDELWKKNMDAIGIRMVFDKQKWPELVEAARLGTLQMWGYAWVVGSASGDSYTQLLYSKNAGQINDAGFNVKQFDAAYEKAQTLPFGPEREEQYRIMSRVAAVHSVFEIGVHTFRTSLAQPWLKGYAPHPYRRYPLEYLLVENNDRDTGAKAR